VSRIYWDSMLFVYWLEDHHQYAPVVREILGRMEQRDDTLCTSALTMGEVLVAPKKRGAHQETQRFLEFFKVPAINLLPFDSGAAERYSDIRAAYHVSHPDALHLASAARAGVDLFLTNDRRLQGLTVPGIQFIAPMDSGIL
jgi:predicted nucleic acid-binding protein